MPYGPSQFQLTVIKPYYKDNSSEPIQDTPKKYLRGCPKGCLRRCPRGEPRLTYFRRGLRFRYNCSRYTTIMTR